MQLGRLRDKLPAWKSLLLAVIAAVMLILAFPDFEFWFLAWFALIPLMAAIAREKDSIFRSAVCGWLFGVVFFLGTGWWLTFAPITYAAFPALLAYFLLLIVCMIVAVFPAAFTGIMALLLRRFGPVAMLSVPFVWVSTEFARYWITGNNWNAIGYTQAFTDRTPGFAEYGGVLFVGCLIVTFSSLIALWLSNPLRYFVLVLAFFVLLSFSDLHTIAGVPRFNGFVTDFFPPHTLNLKSPVSQVVAIQPNVPMSGLTYEKWQELRERHVRMAEGELAKLAGEDPLPTTVVFPESPMNFMYETDRETREFIDGFARRNNVSVLFNSAEPNHADGKFFNSAVLVGPQGGEVAQYDKIYLVPFGEFVPEPLASVVPAFVGSFSQGQDYNLLPIGTGKAGVMICFESHFGQLGREYVLGGADVLIEMTNDGYLGPTPILRQHLANAVFRAVETNRPLLRVTNVGITAYITERGEVRDPAPVYKEDSRVWSVAKSDGSQTLYVRYGDWFAWLCTIVTVGLLGLAYLPRLRS